MKYGDMQRYINALAEARQGSISDLDELLKALDVGIDCMKAKKFKMKPVQVKNISCFGLHRDIYFICPVCRKRVNGKDNFCRKCGQPLKWGK